MIERYYRRPEIVEAICFDGENWNDLTAFFGSKSGSGVWQSNSYNVFIMDGNKEKDAAVAGDYIVKDAAGRFCAYTPEVFKALYAVLKEGSLDQDPGVTQ